MQAKWKYTIALAAVILIFTALATAVSIQMSIINESEESSIKSTKTLEEEYSSLYGDAFDEQYIAGMLAHHEGAVNMSEQALSKSKRPEIRKLSLDIIESQSNEMLQMTEWQKQWGYEQTYSGGHGSHGGGGSDMAGDMLEMQNKLKDKTGEAYDKEFLTQMIIHHTQAIEMSRPAEKNAMHYELKMLARDVILAQEGEVKTMNEWQKQWGYI